MKRASLVLSALVLVSPAYAAAAGVSAGEAKQIATDAYVFLYPLVTMDLTERVSTEAPRPGAGKAPVNQFANLREYPEASNHTVTAPNADTLYSTAWLDLSQGPIVFSHPDMGKRFYLFPILDAYTNVVRTPSARDDGGAAATYVLTGPDWKGAPLPAGATQIKVPTNLAWILGRTYSTGTKQDYDEVHALQDHYTLRPLDGAGAGMPKGGADEAKLDTKTAVRDQVDALKADEFFRRGAALMAANPPSIADAPIVRRMASIGLAPGKPFDTAGLSGDVTAAIASAPQAGQERIKAQMQKGLSNKNGWLITTKAGTYGTDYDQRAFITAIGLGANVPQQAIYPTTRTDQQGRKLSGENQYVIHFAAGQTPPAKAFWSLTMYTPEMFFYENPGKRYTVSSRTPFHKNPDGSIDVYVQHDKPASADQQANWLPAPAEGFALMMRLHWPETKKPSILDGSWAPPPVTRVTPRMGQR
jgi:hypothetical protein